MITLTLYSRTDCHLCVTMHAELLRLLRGRAHVEIVDIDADRNLERRYGERIPVLTAGAAELCCIRLDAARVERYLSAAD
jgi:hypothetical protein